MNKLLTIAIPAYNAEKYLSRCVDSLISERVRSLIQIIIVNDGSKDRTLEFARTYETSYSDCIQVIDKENGNYGSVMNIALSLAQGKYFKTLDADDWYNKEEFVKFVLDLSSTDADMIIGSYEEFYEENQTVKKIEIPKSFPLNRDITVFDSFFESVDSLSFVTTPSVCYKTSVLRSSGLRWSEKVFYSDTQYLYFPLVQVKNIRFVNYPVYIYLIGRNDQSMSPLILKRNFASIYEVTTTIVGNYLETEEVKSPILKSLRLKFVKQILYFFFLGLLFAPEYRERIKLFIEKVETNKLLKSWAYNTTFHKLYFVKSFMTSLLKIQYHIAKLIFLCTEQKRI